MHPQSVLRTEVGNRLERIDGSGGDGAETRNDTEGLESGGEILLDASGQRRNVHSIAIVDLDQANLIGADSDHVSRAGRREVHLCRGVRDELRPAGQAGGAQLDSALGVARRFEADEVRNRSPRHHQSARFVG